ncbi:sterile alpha motif domain-containing protein 9-like [Pimephales promelas]|nr:sterile alpha motif domain-containing protein 9-like [Pimephales promelas]
MRLRPAMPAALRAYALDDDGRYAGRLIVFFHFKIPPLRKNKDGQSLKCFILHKSMATISQHTQLPLRVEEWTRDEVYYWLTELIQVKKIHADKLYEEEVSGEELVCYELKHLQDLETKLTESADPETLDISADKVAETEKDIKKSGSLKPSCTLHPFDQNSASHRYIQNYTLPPETGPGNLTDPVHEYKFMGRTDDMNVMKKKFNKEVFRFAAGCMNSRTNGTIHFGVADSKDSLYAHAEIIGVSLDKKDTIIDHFNQGIKSYFEEHTDDAKACIRQPRFVEVLCPDGTLSGKYVIEVDVIPSHSIVQGKLFAIQTLDEDNQWKRSKGKSLFIRDGAATRDIYKIGNQKDLQDELTRITNQINVLDDRRKEAEKRPESKGTSNQGEKLKNLITCGSGKLDNYEYFIIVTNKSHPEQLQHLQFMTILRLFCVLDYDANSVVNGSCNNYRQVRFANLHMPSQFNGDPGIVVKNLNLYKQTSWVFCDTHDTHGCAADEVHHRKRHH